MGRRGPKPKTAAEHLAAGNPGKRRLREDVKLSAGPLRPPAGLGKIERAEWDRLAKALARSKRLSAEMRAAFVAYVSAWGEFVQADRACRELEQRGALYFTTRHGTRRPAPQLLARSRARADLMKFARELAITPSTQGLVKGGELGEIAREKRGAAKVVSLFADE
jgi:phage terminase small subunit